MLVGSSSWRYPCQPTNQSNLKSILQKVDIHPQTVLSSTKWKEKLSGYPIRKGRWVSSAEWREGSQDGGNTAPTHRHTDTHAHTRTHARTPHHSCLPTSCLPLSLSDPEAGPGDTKDLGSSTSGFSSTQSQVEKVCPSLPQYPKYTVYQPQVWVTCPQHCSQSSQRRFFHTLGLLPWP